MSRHVPQAVLAALSAGAAGPALASGSPIGDEFAIFMAWLLLWAVLLVASAVLAIRRGRRRGRRSGWLFFGLAMLALPASMLLTSLLWDAGIGEPLAMPWRIAATLLAPALGLWTAFVLVVHIDDGREQNRVWKSTR